MRHKYLIGRVLRRQISHALGDTYAGGGQRSQAHPSVSKVPEKVNSVTKVFSSRRLKKARKQTKVMIKNAIREGHTYIQVDVYGDISSKVWMELGWQPVTETWDREVGGMKVTLRMRVPDIPWE